MIVSISVSNFRSFHHEETFALTASNRFAGHHHDHLVSIPGTDQSVLRLGVLYGANGAGKSNLFKALEYLVQMALSSRPRGSLTNREPFQLAGNLSDPSTFDLQFIAAGKVYRFGIKVDDTSITEEWLSEIVGTKEKILYERATSPAGVVTVDASALKSESEKLVALAAIGGPQNQTFLATIIATLEKSDFGPTITTVLKWLRSRFQTVEPGAAFGVIGPYLVDNPDCASFASNFLKSSSTGIDHLKILKQEISEDDLRTMIPNHLLEPILKDISASEDGSSLINVAQGLQILVERSGQRRYSRFNVISAHKAESGTQVAFDLEKESDGTNRLLNLLPALHDLHTSDAVYFIDEIDRSLHPKLVWEFVHFFLATQKHHNSQLILTTHDTNLLDLDLLRRDEIWFAEKDQQSATHLYSLTDFQVRKDLQIRKHYLEGRFGAVPFMGDLERLIPKEPPTA